MYFVLERKNPRPARHGTKVKKGQKIGSMGACEQPKMPPPKAAMAVKCRRVAPWQWPLLQPEDLLGAMCALAP